MHSLYIKDKPLLSTFQSMPLALLSWVCCEQAITDKLSTMAQDVRVSVLSHLWQRTNYWEREMLKINDPTVLRRDVEILAHGQACWFARTMIPQHTYEHDPAFFNRLQHTSLATLIYHEPRIERKVMHSYSLSKALIEYHWISAVSRETAEHLWGRLSTFHFDGQCYFYLFELFLPRFIHALQGSLPTDEVG